MKYCIYFIGFFIGLQGAAAYDCSEEAAEKCVQDVVQFGVQQKNDNDDEIDQELKCTFLRKGVECMSEYAENCVAEEDKDQVQAVVDMLNAKVDDTCREDADDDLEIDDKDIEMLLCISDEVKIVSYVGSCAEVVSSTGYVPINAGADDKCRAFLEISHCTAEKVGEECGEMVEKPFFYGMMLGLKEEAPDAAASEECVNALKHAEEELGLDDDEKKRRKKRRALRRANFRRYASLK